MEDIAQNRAPSDFPEWQANCNAWGKHMLDGCNTVAEMAALGLGL
jgi:isopenicillin N synthase-like dioxygenase